MLRTGRLGRTHFILDKQRVFIAGHGQQVIVTPALQCPCLLADHQFDPICPTCHGSGRLYVPQTSYGTMMLLHQEASKRTFQEAGTWYAGTIRATVLPGIRLCERDKVLLVDITEYFNDEVLTRGLDDSVRFQAQVTIRAVADRERLYRPTIDYVFTPPATITWLPTGLQPAFAQQYSVKYSAAPEFLVVNDTPRLRAEAHIPQAQEVVMMRLDHVHDEPL